MGRGTKFALTHVRGPRTASLKSPCRTSYWSSIATIALNAFPTKDERTNEQTDRQTQGQCHRMAAAYNV